MDKQERTSLQDIQAPTIKFKDRKMLMLLYDQKLKNPQKLARLLKLGYITVRDGEYVPTIVGSLLIDFTIRERNKLNDRRIAKARKLKSVRKNDPIVRDEDGQADHGVVFDGQVDLGDSGATGVIA